MTDNRNRVAYWPLDAYAITKNPDLFWTRQEIMQWRIPVGFDHIGFVEQDHDRGPLLRNQRTGILAMLLPIGAVRSVDQRKVKAAIEAHDQQRRIHDEVRAAKPMDNDS